MESRIIIAIVALTALVGGAWFYLASTGTAPVSPAHKEFVLKVEGGKLTAGPSTLEARIGDGVTIKVTSNEAEEFHLHGYDLSIDLEPGEEGDLTFIADLSGHFVYELEKGKIELGALDVLP